MKSYLRIIEQRKRRYPTMIILGGKCPEWLKKKYEERKKSKGKEESRPQASSEGTEAA